MRVIILIAATLLSIGLHAQDKAKDKVVKVPDAVAKVISTGYPTASELKWSQKNDRYKADFKVGKTDHKVWMDAGGAIVKHEYEIKKAELPKAIQDAVLKEFSTLTIGDCEKTDENGTSTYKVELKSAQGKKKHVEFTSEGKVIEKKK